MLRLVVYLIGIALAASGLAWLADRPGTVQIAWQGYDIETSVFRAAVMLALAVALLVFAWSILRSVWNSPAALGERIVTRRKKRGLDALSSGMIAVGAGDRALATRYALLARKSLPHEPLTHLLRAQAAQLTGDRATARRIYEAMLTAPETEQLGLRGLFLEAEREGATEAAQQFAGRALRSNPKLGWSSDALFDLQCQRKEWDGALETLALAKRGDLIDKATADRRRAVLLAGKAQDAEETASEQALTCALEAHALAPDLVPAAAIAGRILASRGATAKAAKILQRTFVKSPHPDLAMAYAHARVGDSARDRLQRIRQLAALNPHSIESPIAVAVTALEAHLYDEARQVLEPLTDNRLTRRVATLMANIEAGDGGDKGRVREWLARAASAARDPVWIADGVTSDHWEAVSPVTGKLDAFQWRVPVESMDKAQSVIDANRMEELLAIGSPAVTTEPRGTDAIDDERAAEPATARSTPPVTSPSGNAPKPDLRAQNAASREPVTLQPITEARSPARGDARQVMSAKAALPAINGNGSAVSQPRVSGPQQSTGKLATTASSSTARTAAPDGSPRSDKTMFVAPRLPDDPGPDSNEDEATVAPPRRPYRAAP